MAQPRIVEVDYYLLLDKLKAAFAAGGRIEKTDKARWDAYVQAHNVNVTTMQAWAKVKFMRGTPKMAIINHGVDWDGFYIYSEGDEAALKWELGSEPSGA
jgi:hypothetical protein